MIREEAAVKFGSNGFLSGCECGNLTVEVRPRRDGYPTTGQNLGVVAMQVGVREVTEIGLGVHGYNAFAAFRRTARRRRSARQALNHEHNSEAFHAELVMPAASAVRLAAIMRRILSA